MSDTTTTPTGTGFFDTPIAANPLIMGLLGLSSGMAKAAMPSRLPVPLGAAIGMGAGGLAEGLHAAQQGQLAQQQIEQAKLGNELAQARLPLYQQRIGNLLAQPQGGASGASGVVPGALGGPAGSGPSVGSGPSAGPGAVPVGAGGPPHPYVSGPQLFQLANALALLGQDASARSVFSLFGSTGGGTGYTYDQNGNVMPLAGGPADPRVIGRNAAVKDWAGVAPAIATAGGKAAVTLPYDVQRAGQSAAAVAAAQAPYQPPIKYTAPDANGVMREWTVPVPSWAATNGAGAGVPNGAPGAPGAPGSR